MYADRLPLLRAGPCRRLSSLIRSGIFVLARAFHHPSSPTLAAFLIWISGGSCGINFASASLPSHSRLRLPGLGAVNRQTILSAWWLPVMMSNESINYIVLRCITLPDLLATIFCIPRSNAQLNSNSHCLLLAVAWMVQDLDARVAKELPDSDFTGDSLFQSSIRVDCVITWRPGFRIDSSYDTGHFG
ncbi:hypothetical protein TgHK011_000652 [Trichoderma gracile]|nr:hypothetical protein TgHK011_000652 [Trichoderma gracile]